MCTVFLSSLYFLAIWYCYHISQWIKVLSSKQFKFWENERNLLAGLYRNCLFFGGWGKGWVVDEGEGVGGGWGGWGEGWRLSITTSRKIKTVCQLSWKSCWHVTVVKFVVHYREDLSHSILSVYPVGHCSLESFVGLNADQEKQLCYVCVQMWLN